MNVNYKFKYDDANKYAVEIAEFYSYSEENEFTLNWSAFEVETQNCNMLPLWHTLTINNRKSLVMKLLDQIEDTRRSFRITAARCILYIAQGCWAEVTSAQQQQKNARKNSMFLYRLETFSSFVDLLNFEANHPRAATEKHMGGSLENSEFLRVILSILYTITETIRNEKFYIATNIFEYANDVEAFYNDLTFNDDLLMITLFNMITQFTDGISLHFPIKKILLLLWKLLIVFLGGFQDINNMMIFKRKKFNIKPFHDIGHHPRFCKPKVRQSEINSFLIKARKKYLGLDLPNDNTTMIGLPSRIYNSYNILKEHLYIPLSEIQIKEEMQLSLNPFSYTTTDEANSKSKTEFLYEAMLPKFKIYISAILKIMSSIISSSQDIDKLIAEIHSNENDDGNIIQFQILTIDSMRHLTIILKASSAILLLLLKHFKINHIYQFEYLAQYMVAMDCIPKFFQFFQNKNFSNYRTTKYEIDMLEFPSCIFHKQTRNMPLDFDVDHGYSWRHMFICINLLRILNKLTKRKKYRIMLLGYVRATPILKNILNLQEPTCNLYALKLLKMQTTYLGWRWRQQNLNIITMIYLHVRHQLNDDYLSQAENMSDKDIENLTVDEIELKKRIEGFHKRRYSCTKDDIFDLVDNCFLSVLG